MSTRVACLGDSITRAQISADYLAMLEARVTGTDDTFSRHGVNGDFAYNLLQRLQPVVDERPDVITVLIGTNDVRASLDISRGTRMAKRKDLPVAPMAGWYRENLTAIVVRLRTQTDARIALLSLPMLGQELDAPAAAAVGEHSAVVESVAREHGVAYLPLHETQVAHLRASDAPAIPYREAAHPVLNPTLVQHFLMRRSLDEISRRRGLALTTDLIHQNSRGAAMIADLIGTYVAACT